MSGGVTFLTLICFSICAVHFQEDVRNKLDATRVFPLFIITGELIGLYLCSLFKFCLSVSANILGPLLIEMKLYVLFGDNVKLDGFKDR